MGKQYLVKKFTLPWESNRTRIVDVGECLTQQVRLAVCRPHGTPLGDYLRYCVFIHFILTIFQFHSIYLDIFQVYRRVRFPCLDGQLWKSARLALPRYSTHVSDGIVLDQYHRHRYSRPSLSRPGLCHRRCGRILGKAAAVPCSVPDTAPVFYLCRASDQGGPGNLCTSDLT